MKFDRVYDTLHGMEEADGITVLDALDVFYDFCEDVKSKTGSPLEKQPVGNPEETVTRFCWMERLLARIYRESRESFQDWNYRERVLAAEKRLSEGREEMERLKEERDAWEQKKQELEMMNEELERLRRLKEVRDSTQQALLELEKEHREEVEELRLLFGILDRAGEAFEQEEALKESLSYRQSQAKGLEAELKEKRERLFRELNDYQKQYQALVHLVEDNGGNPL